MAIVRDAFPGAQAAYKEKPFHMSYVGAVETGIPEYKVSVTGECHPGGLLDTLQELSNLITVLDNRLSELTDKLAPLLVPSPPLINQPPSPPYPKTDSIPAPIIDNVVVQHRLLRGCIERLQDTITRIAL